jgi:Glyceraldehyde 3-phosphate dehydrogenase, NAD binding domain
MANVAINGLGRIGRAALKILLDSEGLDLVAVNDLTDADNLAYLLKYDTTYGRYDREVTAVEGALVVDGARIPHLPSVIRRTCRGTTWASTSCSSAPGSSRPPKTWRSMFRPVQRT